MPLPKAEDERRDLNQKLSIISPSAHPPTSKLKSRAPAPVPVVDSWEDAADESPFSSPLDSPSAPPRTPASASLPNAPPPTPVTAFHPSSFHTQHDLSDVQFSAGRSITSRQSAPVDLRLRPNYRPEKQVAVAGRMIAGALGVKTPPKSEETRAYEKVVKEREKTRLAREREGKRMEAEEMERTKRAVWDD